MPGSKTIDCGDAGLGRHALGGNDEHLPTFFEDQFAKIVEHIVDFRVR